jgi:hypothetical protein
MLSNKNTTYSMSIFTHYYYLIGYLLIISLPLIPVVITLFCSDGWLDYFPDKKISLLIVYLLPIFSVILYWFLRKNYSSVNVNGDKIVFKGFYFNKQEISINEIEEIFKLKVFISAMDGSQNLLQFKLKDGGIVSLFNDISNKKQMLNLIKSKNNRVVIDNNCYQ